MRPTRGGPPAWRLKTSGFDYFCFLSAIDWMPSPFGKGEDDPTAPPTERDDTINQGYAGGDDPLPAARPGVLDHASTSAVHLKADVPDDLVIESWLPVYLGRQLARARDRTRCSAITFAGHPDLRNIYLPMEFEGFPLRKDFPLLARIVKPWPGIVDVEPMPGDDRRRGR